MAFYTDFGTEADTIQDAINLVREKRGYGTVYIDPGVYAITQEITIYPGIAIVGTGHPNDTILDGSSLNTVSGLKYIFKSTNDVNKENFLFSNLGFKGYFTPGTGSSYATLPGVGGIVINNCENLIINNCYFEQCWNNVTMGVDVNTGSATLDPQNVKNVIISGNTSYNILGGFQTYSVTRLVAYGNIFKDVGDDAFAVLSIGTGTDPQTTQALFYGNNFDNGIPTNINGVEGVGVFLKIDGTNDANNVTKIQAYDNEINNPWIGLYYSNGSEVDFSDNYINTSKRSGIYIISSNDNNVRIKDNTLINTNTSEQSSHGAIFTSGVDDLFIEGNTVKTGKVGGIIINGNPDNVNVINNTVFDVTGNEIYANATNVNISGNKIRGTTSTSRGILLDGCTNWKCDNNTATGNFDSRTIETTKGGGSISFNKLTGTNKGILINVGGAVDGSNVKFIGNHITGLTGSTTDGEAALRLVLTTSSTPVRNIQINDNIMTDGDTSYYAGISIGGATNTIYTSIRGNIITGNKYGLGINTSASWSSQVYTDNIIANNTSYNVSEAGGVTFPDREVGHNIIP